MSNEKTRIELSERFKAIKISWGFSQKEMAERLGIGLSTYQYYERGEREIPAKLLIKLTTYGVGPKWILTGDGDMFESNEHNGSDEFV
jgi:transcriptional regulator with XRE-family HTH domain